MTRKPLVLFFILAAVTLAAVWVSPHDTQATTWAPSFGPTDFYRLDPLTTSANSDIHTQYNVPAPSANFSGLMGRAITFGDPDVFTASAAQIPGVGAYMGQLQSTAQLGLANEGCNSQIPVTFNFVEANVTVSTLAMTPNVTLTSAIGTGDTTFTYTSTGDPIGPSLSNAGGFTKAEIEIDSEQMLVQGINQATNTYSTVTRGWNGTTAAAHSAAAQIRKVNVIFPAGPDDNLLANMAEDDGDFDNNGTAEFPQFAGNQVSDGADAGAPSFIRDSLDPDGDPDNGGYVTPHTRYYGVAFVANTLIVTLQFVILPPGALTQFQSLDWASTAWGYPSVTFLQDPLAPPSNSAISDFCNFSSNTTLYGVPHDNACTGTVTPPAACTGTGASFTLRLAVDGGCPATVSTNPNECGLAGQTNGICAAVTCPRQTNPATAQRVKYFQYGVSQRDLDNDGHENALDVCFNVANPTWNPRDFNVSSGSDVDADGLPTACDPNDGASNLDEDGDGWQNRIDNCPLVANAAPGGGGGTVANTFQFDLDIDPGVNNIATDVPDGGPSSDSIGPACDANPTAANGHYHANYATQTICIGGANSECSDTTDDDGDLMANSRDTCRAGSNPPTYFAGPSGADTLASLATAGSTSITVVDPTGFTQNSMIRIQSPDERVRWITNIVGNTLSLNEALSSAHAAGAAVQQVSFTQSSRDLNNSGFVDTGDIALLTGVFGRGGGDTSQPAGYEARLDINPGVPSNFIDTGDIAQLTGMFGAAC